MKIVHIMKFNTLTASDIDRRGIQTHEPRWLRQQRIHAWEAFQASEYPNWKKTKTPKIDLEESTKHEFPHGVSVDYKIQKKTPEGCSGKITFHGGKVIRHSLDPELAYKGVIFCDMQTAVLERADLLEGYIKESSWGVLDKLTHFQKTFWENGFFLFVPKGMQLSEPFLVQIIQQDPNESIINRSVIIADEASSVIVEEIFESKHTQVETITCMSATEVFAEKSARVKYFSHQDWSDNVYDLSYRRLHAEMDAHIQALFTITGAGAGRTVITGSAEQKGASIEHDAIIVGRKKQRFKIIAEIDHQAEHTQGMMKYKGILKDQSYSDLSGLITVRPLAQMTQSRLEEHTLLLSEKARCDALPALNIQTDNVQVSHAAAVTQADAEKMFYLMSRGLSEAQARALIVEGFFENLLSLITRQECYDQTKQRIEAKMLTPQ